METLKIGITGVQGFMGSEVASFLASNGHETVFLDEFTRQERSALKADKYPKGLRWVLHFGATTSIERSWKDPFGVYRNNIDSTLTAIDIALASGAALLFMSSYVYGRPLYVPVDEKHPVEAINPYMASKIICEQMCQQICRIHSIPLVILRGSNIYGLKYVKGRLISELLESAAKGEQLNIADDKPLRDYLYIKDFCVLVKKVIERQPSGSGIFNAGYGKSYSNMEVAQIIKRLCGSVYPVAVRGTPRPNDIVDASMATTLVKKTFSWEPEYGLEKAAEELVRQKLRG